MTNLKKAREAAKITQSELAVSAGVNFRVLQHYEQGTKKLENAKLETILKLCIALKCRIDEVIDDPETGHMYRAYMDMING